MLTSRFGRFVTPALLGAVMGIQPAPAQLDPPLGATQLGTWRRPVIPCDSSLDCPTDVACGADNECYRYADVWADGNYAYLCHFGHAAVDILDISDPANPVKVAEVFPDPPNEFASAQDVQVQNGLLAIALESNGNDGVLLVDVRDPTNPVKKTLVTILPNFDDVHNVFLHNGILYLANSNTIHIAAVDLTNYDLDAAPATITTALWEWTYGSSFVHDITVQDHVLTNNQTVTRLYACGWNSGLGVYDVADILNSPPVFLGSAPGQSTHSVWATEDGKYVTTGEERGGGPIKNFEVVENGGGSVTLELRDTFVYLTSTAFCVHNQYTVGYRLYNAWYQAGLKVFDIDPVSGALDLIASHDTYPNAVSGFNGAWGVYPLPATRGSSTQVLISDIEYGFFIFDVTGSASIVLPNGLPDLVHPRDGTPVTVKVVEGGQSVDPGSVTLHATNTGQPMTDILMTPIGGGSYQADVPPVPCDSSVEFYFTAQTQSLLTIRNPVTAPDVYSLLPLTGVCENFRDNFEQNLGWTVGAPGDNATSGFWLRGDPNGTVAQPEDDNPNGTGTLCFFTGQGPVGGGSGAADVDGGRTTLLSSIFDATDSDVSVGYTRWYSNDTGAAPNADSFFIDISNNGGTNWVSLEVVTENANAWIEKRFRIADFISPTANMRLRFIAEDLNPGSVVEAAVDDFVLVNAVCSDPPGNKTIDGDLDLADYSGFDDCMAGPGTGVAEGCCAYDIDLDDDVDMSDYLEIHAAFTGPV